MIAAVEDMTLQYTAGAVANNSVVAHNNSAVAHNSGSKRRLSELEGELLALEDIKWHAILTPMSLALGGCFRLLADHQGREAMQFQIGDVYIDQPIEILSVLESQTSQSGNSRDCQGLPGYGAASHVTAVQHIV